MKIPVMVVDDERVDRYTVKRRLDKHGGFAELIEVTSGDTFLDEYCAAPRSGPDADLPVLILMDINMPGRDGFETVAELEARQARGLGPGSVVVMMVTSSANPRDRERAATLRLVKAYAEKPLDMAGTHQLHDLYMTHLDEFRAAG